MNLWEETKDPVSGKSSLSEHTPRVIATYCKEDDHYFEVDFKLREATCRKCGIKSKFIVGRHELKDGKLTNKG